jgi:hypothetical protein
MSNGDDGELGSYFRKCVGDFGKNEADLKLFDEARF